MTNTLQDLKAILDRGGKITNKANFDIHRHRNDYLVVDPAGNCMVYGDIGGFITNPSDWQEVKPERKPFVSREEGAKLRGEFAPRMIVMDPRELEAMEAELHRLRQIVKDTSDPMTPEQEEWFKNRMP